MQELQQEAKLKKELMEVEFKYNMQLRQTDADIKAQGGKPKESFESRGNDVFGGITV
jgi:hypothetical protein